jgi:hypothetical protein
MWSNDGSEDWGWRTGYGDDGARGCCVSEKDWEKAYGVCTRATVGGRIFFITMSFREGSGVLYPILLLYI